jgi:DNA replication protein DnaC
MIDNTLHSLLSELKCRSLLDDIPPDNQAAVLSFLEKEKEARILYRLQRLLATSGLQKQQLRTFEQVDWNFNTSLPRQEILSFRSSAWVESAANLVLIGDVGIGKSHFAKALCYDAIQQGHQVYFATAFDLISKIKKAQSCSARIDYFSKAVRVLCIDELGYTVYQKEDTDIIYQIVAKRSELLPTIITTNLIPKNWGAIFSGSAASATLDRLSVNGTFLTWEGRSYRKHGKKNI